VVAARKAMAGYSLVVKMLLSEYGSEGELTRKQHWMVIQMLCGLFVFFLERLGRFSDRVTRTVDLIASCLPQELQMGL
jgi:hypothetical protein